MGKLRDYDPQKHHDAVLAFMDGRKDLMESPAVDEAPRPVKLPTFVPPECRPIIDAALSEAAKDPTIDPVRSFVIFFRNYNPDQPLPEATTPHPWAGPALKRVERVVGIILTEWKQVPDAAEKLQAIVHVLESELLIDSIVLEAREHVATRGEPFVRQCLDRANRAALLVKSHNKRKGLRQSFQLDRTAGKWYFVDESPDGESKEVAAAPKLIDAAIAEFGPDLRDSDPARRVYHSTWNKGMKRGE